MCIRDSHHDISAGGAGKEIVHHAVELLRHMERHLRFGVAHLVALRLIPVDSRYIVVFRDCLLYTSRCV